MIGLVREKAMPGAHPYLLPPRRPDTLRLHMIFQEGKESLGGEETTPAPLIQVKLQSGQKAPFRLNFNVKPDGLVDLLLCTHALCFLVVVVFKKYIYN